MCAYCGLRDRGQDMGLGSYASWLKPWPCLSPAAGHSRSANLAEPASLPVRPGGHGLPCRVGWKGVTCAGLSGGGCSVPGEAVSSLKETPLGRHYLHACHRASPGDDERGPRCHSDCETSPARSPFLHPSVQLVHPFSTGVSPHPQLGPDPAVPPRS